MQNRLSSQRSVKKQGGGGQKEEPETLRDAYLNLFSSPPRLLRGVDSTVLDPSPFFLRFRCSFSRTLMGFGCCPLIFPATRVISSEPMFGGFLSSQGNLKKERENHEEGTFLLTSRSLSHLGARGTFISRTIDFNVHLESVTWCGRVGCL